MQEVHLYRHWTTFIVRKSIYVNMRLTHIISQGRTPTAL